MSDARTEVEDDTISVEQQVLAAMCEGSHAVDIVRSILTAEHFLEPTHRLLFTAMVAVADRGIQPSPMTVVPLIDLSQTVDGMNDTVKGYFFKMLEAVHVGRDVRSCALVVHEMFHRREMRAYSAGIVERLDAMDATADVLSLAEEMEVKLGEFRLEQVRDQNEVSAAEAYMQEMEKPAEEATGCAVPAFVSHVLSEPVFSEGRLYGLFCSSGEGKTSVAMQCAWHALEHDHPVLFLSYDQLPVETIAQIIAQQTGIEARRQRKPWELLSGTEREDVYEFAARLKGMPFKVVKCSDENPVKLRDYMRAFARRHAGRPTPLCIIDHKQAVTPLASERSDEGSKAISIAQPIKRLLGEIGMTCLLLQQRNSEGLRRPNPRPTRADVHGGQKALQPYDAMMWFYRPHFHLNERLASAAPNEKSKIVDAIGEAADDLALLGATKVRFGEPGLTSRLEWEGRLTKVSDPHEPAAEALL